MYAIRDQTNGRKMQQRYLLLSNIVLFELKNKSFIILNNFYYSNENYFLCKFTLHPQ